MMRQTGSHMRSLMRIVAATILMALPVTINTTAWVSLASADPLGKVYVCKYVGTPGVDERLQTGQNPISVSINSIPDYLGVGSFFADQHGRSYVLAEDVGQPEPDVSECPTPDGPPDQCPDGTNPGDLNGDGVADSQDCGYVPPPDQCPDGTNPGDLNGDGEVNEEDCGYVPPPAECPEGEEWLGDLDGDGVIDENECGIIIDDPDLRGDVTVTSGCGSLMVTNHEDVPMWFYYGPKGSQMANEVKLAAGATQKIQTALRSVDWAAGWNEKDPQEGSLTVSQDCTETPDDPVFDPVQDIPDNPPHAGGAEQSQMPLLLTGAGLALTLLAGLALVATRRRGGAH